MIQEKRFCDSCCGEIRDIDAWHHLEEQSTSRYGVRLQTWDICECCWELLRPVLGKRDETE